MSVAELSGTSDVKRSFYTTLADGLRERVGLRLKDLVANLVEVKRENWSFGRGEALFVRCKHPAPAIVQGRDVMIRRVRIWTGEDSDSLFEEGTIDFPKGARGDVLSDKTMSSSISFRETKSGGTFAQHDAPTRQFVITLSGTLEFKTAKDETFTTRPSDILLAEDTTGTGHSWRLVDDQPWRRAYVILAPDVAVPFRKADH
jgi:hypothetical protein